MNALTNSIYDLIPNKNSGGTMDFSNKTLRITDAAKKQLGVNYSAIINNIITIICIAYGNNADSYQLFHYRGKEILAVGSENCVQFLLPSEYHKEK